ncbi:metal-dependent transcriptional regulator [Occultella glacieicola]|uniref:Metal-dependent transcriptional regulator n=1 Tax=Occultella glacieicola TaxID=2518684 RepID=A0ABY2E8A8_9MICO|nr:metal-dependent transcriptional regulator [Occultella glacieicola]TDE94111.1 metal-dependent transcriptional regulator [Occultella glacieicola]
MADLIDTTEMYLKTVFELMEDGIVPLRARIAERLGHSGPTVSQTVARLERDGLMIVTGDRHLELTEEGLARATRVMRKHRLAERLLTDVIGLDWPHVHEEACRWEHVMSRQVEERLLTLMNHPDHDPYGNPIPGLEEFGEARPVPDLGVALADAVTGDRVEFVLTRIGEPLQVDVELLARFSEAGVRPGAVLTSQRSQDVITVSVEGAEYALEVPEDTARHLFVRSVK